MNENIKITLKTLGWEEIEEMLKEEFIEKAVNLKTEGKSNEIIVSEARGREFASKALIKFLRKLSKYKREEVIKNESFK